MNANDPRDIKPPKKASISTAGRSIVEAIIEELPTGSIATAIGRTAFPPAEEKDRDRWADEVTGRVNEHDRALRPTVTITGTTAALAAWMATTSSDGLHEPNVDLDEVAEALGADHTEAAIQEAAEELEGFGLLSVNRYIGGGIVQPTWRLFAALDPHIKGWNVDEDARALALLVLDPAGGFAASELEQRSGLERRRFNPALSKLLTFFDRNLVSEEIQPDYPSAYAHLSGGARARLRRFIEGK